MMAGCRLVRAPHEIPAVRDRIFGGARDTTHALDEFSFLMLDNLAQDVGNRLQHGRESYCSAGAARAFTSSYKNTDPS